MINRNKKGSNTVRRPLPHCVKQFYGTKLDYFGINIVKLLVKNWFYMLLFFFFFVSALVCAEKQCYFN